MDDSKLRLSTREREAALESLSTHFADGRLTVEEFDERAAEVAKATTRGELAPLFADLPESRTSSLVNVTNQREVEEMLRRKKRVELIHGGVWAVTFILFFVAMAVLELPYFWIVFPIAGVISVTVDEMMGLTKEQKRLLGDSPDRKELEP